MRILNCVYLVIYLYSMNIKKQYLLHISAFENLQVPMACERDF